MAILKDGIYGELNTESAAVDQPSFWQTALVHLQTVIAPEAYQSWIKAINTVSLDGGIVTLRVPNAFFSMYIRNHFEEKIIHSVALATGKHCKVDYAIGNAGESSSDAKENTKDGNSNISAASKAVNAPLLSPLFPELAQKQAETIAPAMEETPLANFAQSAFVNSASAIKAVAGYIDTKHTFETFIVGAGTQLSFAAAKGVAGNPGGRHNPLLIYGPSGLGKTHLLHAIALQILKANPKARICYLPAEQFVNDFIDATKRGGMNEFQMKYRSKFDVFLIDDIQFFGGKDRSQEEFFHTFNHLCGTRNQVVMTSDKAPKELSGLEERLITRLQQGLVVDVKPPDLETRMAILSAKAEADDVYLPDDVCLMIATNIRSNVRELEGALVRLGAEASINGSEITVEMARESLKDLLNEHKINHLSVESINRSVSQYFKISLAELNSKSRAKKYVEPRQIAMYLCRKYTKKTLPDIAESFGGKDHSTVIHAINKIEKGIALNPTVKKQVEDIQQLL